ncbi:MAG: hypothetical protein H0X33_03405 [Taibaiella sp.]|nr:hypothetical protein [Taibaiella sp.]
MQLKKYGLILRFYKSYALAPLLITLACWRLVLFYGSHIVVLLCIFKIVTYLFLYFLLNNYNRKRLYFYYNLHLSKAELWYLSFLFDLLFFIAGIFIILIGKR